MALQHPADEDLLHYYVFTKVLVLVVLYEYPVTIEALLQFMGKAAGLQLTLGDTRYSAVIASEGQHMENAKLDGTILLRTVMFPRSQEDVLRFANALTGGDKAKLFDELNTMENGLRVTYGGQR